MLPRPGGGKHVHVFRERGVRTGLPWRACPAPARPGRPSTCAAPGCSTWTRAS
jgi:hypothetical protein